MAQIDLPDEGLFIGRAWRPGFGPVLVTPRQGQLYDITSIEAPTMRDLLEIDDIAGHLADHPGEAFAALGDLPNGPEADSDQLRLLSPPDLQAIKGACMTFPAVMVERVMDEQAAGDRDRAQQVRARIGATLAEALRGIKAGSDQAAQLRQTLLAEGLWSQYLDLGIGPDAGIVTTCPAMAAVGWGAQIGLHPDPGRSDPAPQIVLAINSRGQVRGATLGNGVTRRDFHGRPAALPGRAGDHNASSALGPFIRILDDGFTVEDLRRATVSLRIEGRDGFALHADAAMAQISHDPDALVTQMMGRHHQYPDGVMLHLGAMFALAQDRDRAGQGFTHQPGDVVTLTQPALGRLVNHVALATDIPEWRFGTAALMRNLVGRALL